MTLSYLIVLNGIMNVFSLHPFLPLTLLAISPFPFLSSLHNTCLASICKTPDPTHFPRRPGPPAHFLYMESFWHSLEKEARNRLHGNQLSGHGRLYHVQDTHGCPGKCLDWEWGSQMLQTRTYFFLKEEEHKEVDSRQVFLHQETVWCSG